MNPSLYTKWLYKHNGEESRIKVVGIWGKGFRDNYQVTAYELKQDNKMNIDMVAASKMKAMIASGKLTLIAAGPGIPD